MSYSFPLTINDVFVLPMLKVEDRKCRFWVTLFIRASNHVEHEDLRIVETNFNVIISIESIIWMHVVIWSLVVSNLQRILNYTIYSSCMCLKFLFEANHQLSGNKLHHNMLCFIYYIQHLSHAKHLFILGWMREGFSSATFFGLNIVMTTLPPASLRYWCKKRIPWI